MTPVPYAAGEASTVSGLRRSRIWSAMRRVRVPDFWTKSLGIASRQKATSCAFGTSVRDDDQLVVALAESLEGPIETHQRPPSVKIAGTTKRSTSVRSSASLAAGSVKSETTTRTSQR